MIMTNEQAEELAREQYASDDIEIDDTLTDADFSPAEDGTWVHAWVWVANKILNKEN